jgi:chromosome segregation ATPase
MKRSSTPLKSTIARPVAFILVVYASFAQSPAPNQVVQPVAQTSSPAADAPSRDDDRFPALYDQAQQRQAAFTKLDAESMDEVDVLLKSKQCQINRINGLLDRTLASLSEYRTAWVTYYTKWNEAEQRRIDDQKKSLASMETDQQRVKELIDSDTQEHDDLLRRKANLEKTKRTQEIIKDIDDLVEQINDSQTRLDEAKKNYELATTKVNDMQTSIAARVIAMHQNLDGIEAFGLQRSAFYERRRSEAQERCNLKRPGQKSAVPLSTQPQ